LVRFTSKADIDAAQTDVHLCANSGHSAIHSITFRQYCVLSHQARLLALNHARLLRRLGGQLSRH
jgi:hypothetical protein